jgi:hypothetical protein
MTAPVLFRGRHHCAFHLAALTGPHARALWRACSGMHCQETLPSLRECHLNSRRHPLGSETLSLPPQPVGLQGSS